MATAHTVPLVETPSFCDYKVFKKTVENRAAVKVESFTTLSSLRSLANKGIIWQKSYCEATSRVLWHTNNCKNGPKIQCSQMELVLDKCWICDSANFRYVMNTSLKQTSSSLNSLCIIYILTFITFSFYWIISSLLGNHF